MKTKLVIFDLDGTLVDAYRAIIESVNFTLKKLGYREAPVLAVRRAVGWGDKNLLSAFVDKEDIAKALFVYRSRHRIELIKYAKLLPSARKLLNYLDGHGFKIAIASNRPTEFTGIILRHLGIRDYFDYVICADKLPEGKPHPEILFNVMKRLKVSPQKVIYVGDMALDVETAHNAGLKAIAVSGGSSTLAEIKKARPFKIIKSLASLKKYL